MNLLFKTSILSLFILGMFSACNTPKHGTKKRNPEPANTNARLENSFQKVVVANARVLTDTSIEMDFLLQPANFLHKIQNADAANAPAIRFHFTVIADDKSNHILDTFTYWVPQNLMSQPFINYTRGPISCYSVNVNCIYDIYDPAEHIHYKNIIPFNFGSAFSANYFNLRKITGPGKAFTTPQRFFHTNDSCVVDYYKSKIQKLYVRYSPAIGRPSPTPFYKGQQKVLLANFRNSFNIPNGGVLSFKMPGNYLIQTDTTKREGLWVNVFSDGFPFPSTESDYLNPLVYLISEQEYLSMSQSENKKKAIDEFWNKCAGDADKGPLLADEYYKRVKESNDNFTTSKEGWKTDRGMVYILYGKPDMVSKESWGESWTYNAHYPYAAVEFRFTRSEQAWGYDYTLMREAHYKNLWYQAIDNWRNGRTKGR